jgi:glyoxylase-like metal-dependent hydrolase (beta-lactamase superfamily II)/8-oxo-dGTP pyrophosphatase MutT (NUDIX family)
VSQITKAASVLLARGSGPAELFVVRRAEKLRFFGGFVAFPGGKVAPADGQTEVSGECVGGEWVSGESCKGLSLTTHPLTTSESCSTPVGTAVAHDRCVAAARELFEETGILLARRADGTFSPSGSALDYLRRKVIAGEMTFQQVLSRLELKIRAADFVPLGAITTPPFVPNRFDTAFFLCRTPSQQQAAVWPGELDEGEWATAAGVLQRWTRGERLVSPPTVAILQAIVDRPVDEIADRLVPLLGSLSTGAIHPIYFAPDVQLIPLFTQSLPPSTHTNAYLVGRDPSYLLDPGTNYAEEQERLFAVLDRHQAKGSKLTAVVLTHHHPDHIGAAAVCSQRYGVPIYAHSLTAKALEGRIKVDRHISDGERLDLGTAPDGSAAWHLEAIHTPGHASGHLAFFDPQYRLLFAADMVSTLSSVVIAPPDGNLATYLESLRRLKTYPSRLLLPAHGSPSPRPQEVLDECIAHRVQREEQLVAALASAPRTVAELAVELYKGLPPNLMRFAEWQVRAGLQKLQSEGRIEAASAPTSDKWMLRR